MTATEIDTVGLEELELFGREHEGLIPSVLFVTQEALGAVLEVVADQTPGKPEALTWKRRRRGSLATRQARCVGWSRA